MNDSATGSSETGGENAGTPSSETPPASAVPTPNSDFTPDQLKQMAGWMVEDGKLTQEEADASLVESGVNQTANTDDPYADTPEAKEIDRGFPPARPEEFQFPNLSEGDKIEPAVVEFDKTARGWLTGGRFTATDGSFLANEVDRVSRQTESMSDVDRQVWASGEKAKLQKLWGPDFNRKTALAQQLVREIDKKSADASKAGAASLSELLEQSGAGNSALVISKFVFQAERLLARQGKQAATK